MKIFKSEKVIDGTTWLSVKQVYETKTSEFLIKKTDIHYYESGTNMGKINKKAMIGKVVTVIYHGNEYQLKIKNLIGNGRDAKFVVDVNGYYDIDLEMRCDHFFDGFLGTLINNIYASPKAPEYSYYTREEMIEIIGEEVAKCTTWGSNQKIIRKCLYCKHQKTQKLNHIATRGLACDVCGHGKSLPERFMKCCLDKAGVSYKQQFIIDGYDYKYDFYLTKLKTILETNGDQHYSKKHNWGMSLEKQQERDKIKKDVAITEGIVLENNYYQIDNRKSNFNFLKEKNDEIFKILGISLTDEQYKEAFKEAQEPICIKICEYFNNNDSTVTETAKVFNTSTDVVRKALKQGTDAGLCKYDAQEELIKNGKKGIGGKNGNAKKIRCIETNQIFESIADATRFYNVGKSIISLQLKGGIKQVTLNDGTKLHFEYVDQTE